MLRFNTLFYHKTPTVNRPKVEGDHEDTVDMSVDPSDPEDPEFDPTDRDLEHHHEQNRRELPRLAMELMACGLSFVHVARIVNSALEDYGVITADDTSQSKAVKQFGKINNYLFSVVTPMKLYRESLKLGIKLNAEALARFRMKPPAIYGFDGKIMDVKSYDVDSRGVQHPVRNKKDQIGEIKISLPINVCLLSPGSPSYF